MIRILVARYFPDHSKDVYVNIGVLAQDGAVLMGRFCSDKSDLKAIENIDLEAVPLNVGEVFENNIREPLTRLDYDTMTNVEISLGSEEFFSHLRSNGYMSHLRYSDIITFDVPKLSAQLVESLYDIFVLNQYGNPYSGQQWQQDVRSGWRSHDSHRYVKVV